MSGLGLPCPSPPDFSLDWDALVEAFDWVRALGGCLQDAEHHAEGDVLVHTRLVLEELLGLEAFRRLEVQEREVLFAAALLHDVAKPQTTREELGRITARGHAGRGEVLARRILWDLGAPLRCREQVCQLVRFHELPFFLIGLEDAEARALAVSQVASCELAALLAEADARGRRSATRSTMLDAVELFRDLCRELGCFDRPYPFGSDQGRFEYFRTPGRDPTYLPHEEPGRAELILLSGVAGVGKDRWVSRHARELPVISLDDIRVELGARPAGRQGAVVQRAREVARVQLRARRRFVWNATNLSRKIRREVIGLAAGYGAQIRIVYLEVPPAMLHEQNRGRPDAVPEAALGRMLERWQVPDLTEAHRVDWNDDPAGWL